MEERRGAEQRQRLDDAAAGIEQFVALVGDDDLRRPAAGEMALDLVGEMMDVDHGGLDAGRRQPVEHVIDQRLAADRDQRLRHVSVSGRMRMPSPAASTMARRGTGEPIDFVIATSANPTSVVGKPNRNVTRDACCSPPCAGKLGGSGGSHRPDARRRHPALGYHPRDGEGYTGSRRRHVAPDTSCRARRAPDGSGRAADRRRRGAGGAGIAACRRGGRAGRKCRGSWWRAAPRASHRAARSHRRRSPVRRRAAPRT